MINLAVFNIKDIVKYLIKILIIILLLWLFTSKFLTNTILKNQFFTNKIDSSKLVGLLDNTIPGMKQLNKQDEEIHTNINNINPLDIILETQLGMLYTTEKIQVNNINNSVIGDGISDNQEEIINIEKPRNKSENRSN